MSIRTDVSKDGFLSRRDESWPLGNEGHVGILSRKDGMKFRRNKTQSRELGSL
jgi:hypothetical protein